MKSQEVLKGKSCALHFPIRTTQLNLMIKKTLQVQNEMMRKDNFYKNVKHIKILVK